MALKPYTDKLDEERVIQEHHGSLGGSCVLKHKTSSFKCRRVFPDSFFNPNRDSKSVYGKCPLCKEAWVRLGLP